MWGAKGSSSNLIRVNSSPQLQKTNLAAAAAAAAGTSASGSIISPSSLVTSSGNYYSNNEINIPFALPSNYGRRQLVSHDSPAIFPTQSPQVFFQHTRVTLNYWLCSGLQNCSWQTLIGVLGLAVLSGIASVLLAQSHLRSGSYVSNITHPQITPPSSRPNASGETLNLEDSFLLLDNSYWKPYNEPEKDKSNTTQTSYGVIIDAGSSGSRIMIYSWENVHSQALVNSPNKLPQVGMASFPDGNWFKSIEPGLSSLAPNPSPLSIAEYLSPLLDFAQSHVPKHAIASTPIYLFATGGMRLLSPPNQEKLLKLSCNYVGAMYGFSLASGCEKHFRVISGELEGVFGWVTVNYLTKDSSHDTGNSNLLQVGKHPTATTAFAELGGASMQVAFEKQLEESNSTDVVVPVRSLVLRTLHGHNINVRLSVASVLGFGVNEARRQYLNFMSKKSSAGSTSGSASSRESFKRDNDDNENDDDVDVVDDPCFPEGLRLTESSSEDNAKTNVAVLGSGSFQECSKMLQEYIRPHKSGVCTNETACLLAQIRNDILAENRQNGLKSLLATSEFYYTTEAIFGLSGDYDYAKLSQAAEQYCKTPWTELLDKYRDVIGSPQRRLDPSKYSSIVKIDIRRLQLQCFRVSWIMSLLHDGFGIPRGESGSEHNEDKGPGSSSLQIKSSQIINGLPITWTLGAMLFHVCSKIPPKSPQPHNATIISSDNHPTTTTAFQWILLESILLWILFIFSFLAIASIVRIGWRKYHRQRRRSKGSIVLPMFMDTGNTPFLQDLEESGFPLQEFGQQQPSRDDPPYASSPRGRWSTERRLPPSFFFPKDT